MLFLPPGSARLLRIHGAFVSEKEIARLTAYLRKAGKPSFDDSVGKTERTTEAVEADDRDDSSTRPSASSCRAARPPRACCSGASASGSAARGAGGHDGARRDHRAADGSKRARSWWPPITTRRWTTGRSELTRARGRDRVMLRVDRIVGSVIVAAPHDHSLRPLGHSLVGRWALAALVAVVLAAPAPVGADARAGATGAKKPHATSTPDPRRTPSSTRRPKPRWRRSRPPPRGRRGSRNGRRS